ncbi:MAG: SRPBCC family protein [Phycisphaerae bacterium]|nr:SRPBCC family protein [Saprospiraceae bacterium]
MKILKKILIALGILIAIPFIAALFMSKDYAVEREITINKPKQEVFDYVKYLKNQDNWSTWNQMDPKMKHTYRGTDGTVGFVSAWESDKMGNGEQEIKKITEGERIDAELRFKGMFASVSPAYMTTEAVNDSTTKVKQAMSGHMAYPMNFMQVFMSMEEMIGTEYEKSLAKLKGILEKQ